MIPKDASRPGPTDITLREYVEAIVNGLDVRLNERLDGQASRSVERLEHLNIRLEQRFDALVQLANNRATELADSFKSEMRAAKEAVVKAEQAVEKRLEGLNEMRGMNQDMRQTLLPRTEADGRFAAVGEQISGLEKQISGINARLDKNEGSGHGLQSGWMILTAALAAGAAIVAIYNFANGPRTDRVFYEQAPLRPSSPQETR
jgi:chromosome segregation ATPase